MQAMLDRMGADQMPMDDIDGMDGEMADLEAADRAEFERRFLEGMSAQHQAAIDMSEGVLAEGQDPEVATLAEEIIAVPRPGTPIPAVRR